MIGMDTFGASAPAKVLMEKFGFSVQSKIEERNVLRKKAGRIGTVSENGLHYSWDWDQVHFVQANLYPADKQHAKVTKLLAERSPSDAPRSSAERNR